MRRWPVSSTSAGTRLDLPRDHAVGDIAVYVTCAIDLHRCCALDHGVCKQQWSSSHRGGSKRRTSRRQISLTYLEVHVSILASRVHGILCFRPGGAGRAGELRLQDTQVALPHVRHRHGSAFESQSGQGSYHASTTPITSLTCSRLIMDACIACSQLAMAPGGGGGPTAV